MRWKKRVGLHLLPVETKGRGSNQTPLYLADDVELVPHVHRIVVWPDLIDRRRAHTDRVVPLVRMGRFVQYLTAFMGEDGITHGHRG